MIQKIELTICMGSSCFSRGNKRHLQIIQDFIKEYALEDYVTLQGSHCFGLCSEGPVLQANGRIYKYIDEQKLYDILNDVFQAYIVL